MLVRLVSAFIPQWEAEFAYGKGYTLNKLPHWALSTFAPGEKENGRISLYEIDEHVTVADVAAAMAFLKQSTARWFFLGSSRAELEEQGFELIETKGTTHHPAVNERHRDVAVPDRMALGLIASIFLEGEPLNVEKKEVETKLIAQARTNSIDWLGTAKGSNDNAWRHVREFTKKQAVALQGQVQG